MYTIIIIIIVIIIIIFFYQKSTARQSINISPAKGTCYCTESRRYRQTNKLVNVQKVGSNDKQEPVTAQKVGSTNKQEEPVTVQKVGSTDKQTN